MSEAKLTLSGDILKSIGNFISMVPSKIFGSIPLRFENGCIKIEATSSSFGYIISFKKEIEDLEVDEPFVINFLADKSIDKIFTSFNTIEFYDEYIHAMKLNKSGDVQIDTVLTLLETDEITEVPHSVEEIYDFIKQANEDVDDDEKFTTTLDMETISDFLGSLKVLAEQDKFIVDVKKTGQFEIIGEDYTKTKVAYTFGKVKCDKPFKAVYKEHLPNIMAEVKSSKVCDDATFFVSPSVIIIEPNSKEDGEQYIYVVASV